MSHTASNMPRNRVLMAVTGIFTTGGGIASVNRLVIRSFLENNYQVDVFALVEEERKLPDFAAGQTEYHVFAGDKFAFAWALWKAQVARQYDLVFCDHINVASALAPGRLVLRRPYVVWVHGNEVFPAGPSFEGKIGLNFAAKRLTSSEFTRDQVLQRSPTKTTISCDLALEPDRWGLTLPDEPPELVETAYELRALDGLEYPLGKQIILHVGRMDPGQRYKGHEELLRAFPEILVENPDAQLVLAGTGEDYSYLETIGQSLPAQAQQAIFMPGFVSDTDLSMLYNRCSLFAMPSREEGFGIVYLEAMRFAKPCVGSRVDAASCVITDGETGLLVDNPESYKEIASKINWLLSHPEKANGMGISGYHTVRNRHLFPEFKKRLFRILTAD